MSNQNASNKHVNMYHKRYFYQLGKCQAIVSVMLNAMIMIMTHINLYFRSLYENQIRCIMPGAFDQMKSLVTLNLLSNPLICNCQMKWLSDWLRNNNIATGNPKCSSPDDLKDVPIQDVQANDFTCSEQGTEEMIEFQNYCGSKSVCPARCTCKNSTVRCSRLKLTSFPSYIQISATQLYLDVNEISDIPRDINRLEDLTLLDLSNNRITALDDNIFINLTKLETLILSYNKLACIQPDSFKGLKSLRMLSLYSNDISMMSDRSFQDLISLTHVALGSNPLYCDCKLRWLAEWIQDGYTEPGMARCSDPKSMRDKLLLTASGNDFECTKEPEPEVLAKCNLCYSFPCRNEGICKSKSFREFECSCAPGFYGPTCESKIDACFGNPCENDGICKVLETGRFSCHCPPGFEGDRCESNIDDCVDHKCKNNATCIDLVESYQCKCNRGYVGEFCEKKIEFCSKDFNPCQNGATCIDHISHYSCACPLGWTGENCTINVDDCVEVTCHNGGTCVDQVNSYRCECPDGFSGSFCEATPLAEMLYPQTSPCQQHDCKHGVCFQPSGSNDYVCKCSPGFTGKHCDLLSSVSFHENAYLEFDPLITQPYANITLTFATLKTNGVILYTGDGDLHLGIELFRGRIRVSLDIGNHPVSTMFSYEVVSDGKYHTVQFFLVSKNFTMTVNNGPSRSIVNEGKNEYLKISKPLYLGGLPESVFGSAIRYHIWNSSSFLGCMTKIFVNDNPLDIMVANKQQQVTPGCSQFSSDNVCDNNLCNQGKCLPIDHLNYKCKCKSGWSGPFCDQGKAP